MANHGTKPPQKFGTQQPVQPKNTGVAQGQVQNWEDLSHILPQGGPEAGFQLRHETGPEEGSGSIHLHGPGGKWLARVAYTGKDTDSPQWVFHTGDQVERQPRVHTPVVNHLARALGHVFQPRPQFQNLLDEAHESQDWNRDLDGAESMLKAEGKKKGGTWAGRSILDGEDAKGLEAEAALREFRDRRPRAEAEEDAHRQYRHGHHQKAAAHHLRGMKMAQASGQTEEAHKHSVMYALHLQKLGHDPYKEPPPEVRALLSKEPDQKQYRYKDHGGDGFILEKGEELSPGLVLKKAWPKTDAENESNAQGFLNQPQAQDRYMEMGGKAPQEVKGGKAAKLPNIQEGDPLLPEFMDSKQAHAGHVDGKIPRLRNPAEAAKLNARADAAGYEVQGNVSPREVEDAVEPDGIGGLGPFDDENYNPSTQVTGTPEDNRYADTFWTRLSLAAGVRMPLGLKKAWPKDERENSSNAVADQVIEDSMLEQGATKKVVPQKEVRSALVEGNRKIGGPGTPGDRMTTPIGLHNEGQMRAGVARSANLGRPARWPYADQGPHESSDGGWVENINTERDGVSPKSAQAEKKFWGAIGKAAGLKKGWPASDHENQVNAAAGVVAEDSMLERGANRKDISAGVHDAVSQANRATEWQSQDAERTGRGSASTRDRIDAADEANQAQDRGPELSPQERLAQFKLYSYGPEDLVGSTNCDVCRRPTSQFYVGYQNRNRHNLCPECHEAEPWEHDPEDQIPEPTGPSNYPTTPNIGTGDDKYGEGTFWRRIGKQVGLNKAWPKNDQENEANKPGFIRESPPTEDRLMEQGLSNKTQHTSSTNDHGEWGPPNPAAAISRTSYHVAQDETPKLGAWPNQATSDAHLFNRIRSPQTGPGDAFPAGVDPQIRRDRYQTSQFDVMDPQEEDGYPWRRNAMGVQDRSQGTRNDRFWHMVGAVSDALAKRKTPVKMGIPKPVKKQEDKTNPGVAPKLVGNSSVPPPLPGTGLTNTHISATAIKPKPSLGGAPAAALPSLKITPQKAGPGGLVPPPAPIGAPAPAVPHRLDLGPGMAGHPRQISAPAIKPVAPLGAWKSERPGLWRKLVKAWPKDERENSSNAVADQVMEDSMLDQGAQRQELDSEQVAPRVDHYLNSYERNSGGIDEQDHRIYDAADANALQDAGRASEQLQTGEPWIGEPASPYVRGGVPFGGSSQSSLSQLEDDRSADQAFWHRIGRAVGLKKAWPQKIAPKDKGGTHPMHDPAAAATHAVLQDSIQERTDAKEVRPKSTTQRVAQKFRDEGHTGGYDVGTMGGQLPLDRAPTAAEVTDTGNWPASAQDREHMVLDRMNDHAESVGQEYGPEELSNAVGDPDLGAAPRVSRRLGVGNPALELQHPRVNHTGLDAYTTGVYDAASEHQLWSSLRNELKKVRVPKMKKAWPKSDQENQANKAGFPLGDKAITDPGEQAVAQDQLNTTMGGNVAQAQATQAHPENILAGYTRPATDEHFTCENCGLDPADHLEGDACPPGMDGEELGTTWSGFLGSRSQQLSDAVNEPDNRAWMPRAALPPIPGLQQAQESNMTGRHPDEVGEPAHAGLWNWNDTPGGPRDVGRSLETRFWTRIGQAAGLNKAEKKKPPGPKGKVLKFPDRKGQVQTDKKAKVKEVFDQAFDTMSQDPGFQELGAQRRREAQEAELKAGPARFHPGDRVRHATRPQDVPWMGVVGPHNPLEEGEGPHRLGPSYRENDIDGPGHYFNVKWWNPKAKQWHQDWLHQDDLNPW